MKPEKILDDVVQSAIGAKAHLDMYRAQTSIARPKFNRAIEQHSHFFRASQDAHYISFFVCFARLYEEKKDSSSIWNYLRIAGKSMDEQTLAAHRIKYEALKPRAKPMLIARHKTVAHMDALLEEKEVFLPLKIKWDDVRLVISETCDLVKSFKNAKHFGDIGIPEGDMLIKATIELLEAVEKSR